MHNIKYVFFILLFGLISNQSFSQNAGSDQDLCDVLSTTLDADDPSPNTGTWTVVGTPPGSVSFTDNTLYNTDVTVGAYGSYTFRWTLNIGGSDDVTITFRQSPTTANAGPDQTGSVMCDITSTTLAGNSPAIGTGTWSIESGTGGSISTPGSPTSTFSGT